MDEYRVLAGRAISSVETSALLALRGLSVYHGNHEFIGDLVRAYYWGDGNGVGGYLHIVLDDGNTDAVSINWCIARAESEGDLFGALLGRLLLTLPEEDRWITRSGRVHPR
jgi:hypothetical protein